MHSPALDGYTIDRPVGRNPYGRLYAASRLGRPCVLALLDTGDPALNQKYLATVHAMAALHHPNLIRVVDSGVHPEGFYVAWEAPNGSDLRMSIGEKRFIPFERKLDAIAELCDGLDSAHMAGFVHRNIEPRHIFLEDTGSVKLGEFVFMESGRLQLSPYSAPEQLHGATSADAKSDQFSLAAVLYEWLAGTPPFHGGHGHSVLARIISEPHPPLRKHFPACAADLDRILDRALAKGPEERFPTCGEFGRALRGFAERVPGLAEELLHDMARRASFAEAGARALTALIPNYSAEDQPSFSAAAPEQQRDYGFLLECHAEADRYLSGSRDALQAALPLLGQLKTAYDLFLQQDFGACERELGELLSGVPNHAPARRLLQICRRRSSSHSRRLEYRTRMATLLAETRSALDREQTSLALMAANAILEFNPAQADALSLQQEATRKLNQADLERKQKIKELLETCRARLRTGQYDAAIKASEELLKLAPESGFRLSTLQLEVREDPSEDEKQQG